MKEFCIDLKLAKELKKEGFPQKTHFSYAKSLKYGNLHLTTKELMTGWIAVWEIYDAPTSDELLKELPFEINEYILEIIRYETGTIEADYTRYGLIDEDVEYLIQSKKLFYKSSDALAELWLDLKKEGYIK